MTRTDWLWVAYFVAAITWTSHTISVAEASTIENMNSYIIARGL